MSALSVVVVGFVMGVFIYLCVRLASAARYHLPGAGSRGEVDRCIMRRPPFEPVAAVASNSNTITL